MLTLLTIAGALVAYLLVACVVTATMMQFGPNVIRRDDVLAWATGLLFPLSLPYIAFIYTIIGVWHGMMFVTMPIKNLMKAAVEHMTRPKSKLPKAEVHK